MWKFLWRWHLIWSMRLTPQKDQLKAFRSHDLNYVSAINFKCQKFFFSHNEKKLVFVECDESIYGINFLIGPFLPHIFLHFLFKKGQGVEDHVWTVVHFFTLFQETCSNWHQHAANNVSFPGLYNVCCNCQLWFYHYTMQTLPNPRSAHSTCIWKDKEQFWWLSITN